MWVIIQKKHVMQLCFTKALKTKLLLIFRTQNKPINTQFASGMKLLRLTQRLLCLSRQCLSVDHIVHIDVWPEFEMVGQWVVMQTHNVAFKQRSTIDHRQ